MARKTPAKLLLPLIFLVSVDFSPFGQFDFFSLCLELAFLVSAAAPASYLAWPWSGCCWCWCCTCTAGWRRPSFERSWLCHWNCWKMSLLLPDFSLPEKPSFESQVFEGWFHFDELSCHSVASDLQTFGSKPCSDFQSLSDGRPTQSPAPGISSWWSFHLCPHFHFSSSGTGCCQICSGVSFDPYFWLGWMTSGLWGPFFGLYWCACLWAHFASADKRYPAQIRNLT